MAESTTVETLERPASLSERFKEYMERRAEGCAPKLAEDPVYICRVCKDIGFVYARDERGRVDYSNVIPCPAHGCAGQRAEQARLDDAVAAGRGVKRPGQTFDTFESVDGARNALNYARSLADGTARFIWLLIYGNTGNGKTHLCNAIAKTTIRRGVDARLVAVTDLFSALRTAIDLREGESVMERYKQTGVLVLDDYGVHYGTDWEAARLDELLTHRYASLLPTVMTTNLDIADLPARIRSRFEDREMARVVHNTARDYRAK